MNLINPVSFAQRLVCKAASALPMLAAVACGVAANASDLLLQEIVAGCDANAFLLQKGTATYAVTREGYHPERAEPGETEVRSFDYTVAFDYPLIRTDDPNEKIIFRPRNVISYRTNMGSAKSYPAYEHSAVITDRATSKSPTFHPRAQRSEWFQSAASWIRIAADLPEGAIDASETGDGLIKLTVDLSNKSWLGRMSVDPSKGYSLVRLEEYALKLSSEQPSEVMTADYVSTANGAFILSERDKTSWLAINNELKKQSREVLKLVRLDDRGPDAAVFRLESLGLPKTAYIEDRINKKHYIFGVSAVTEADIPALGATPNRTPYKLWVMLALAVVAFGIVVRKAMAKRPQ
jgi:hypothetical protein